MEALQFLPLTEHEQDSLHLSLLGGRVELTRVEPQFLPPGKWKAVIYQFGLQTTSDLVFQRKPLFLEDFEQTVMEDVYACIYSNVSSFCASLKQFLHTLQPDVWTEQITEWCIYR